MAKKLIVIALKVKITTGPRWLTKSKSQNSEPDPDLVEMFNTTLEEMNSRENAAPELSGRFHLPFGGSTSSKERHVERWLEKSKEKRMPKRSAKQTLKEKVQNGQEPHGWLNSGAISNFIAPQDTRHLKSMGIWSGKKRVKLPNGQTVEVGVKMMPKHQLRHPAQTQQIQFPR